MQNPWRFSHSLITMRASGIKYRSNWLSPSFPRASDKRALTSGISVRSEVLSEVVVPESEGSVRVAELLATFSWAGDLELDGEVALSFHFPYSACKCGRFPQCMCTTSVFLCEWGNQINNRSHDSIFFCYQYCILDSQDHLYAWNDVQIKEFYLLLCVGVRVIIS